MAKEQDNSRPARLILYCLVTTLVLEGVLRKLVPASSHAITVVLFFLKDVWVCAMGFYVFRRGFSIVSPELTQKFQWLIICFSILIFYTATKSVLLAVFGGKQYLLFPVVAFGTILAFEKSDARTYFKFLKFMGLLIIVTAVMAVIQSQLPMTHLLNKGVGGSDLTGFSAGGKLRLSSTFSFVAQYGMFLNASTFLVGMLFFIRQRQGMVINRIFLWSLFPALLVGTFLTGSRGAVMGNAAIIAGGGAFIAWKGNAKTRSRFLSAVAAIIVLTVVVETFFPDVFVVYKARSSGSEEVSHQREMGERVFSALTGWTGGLEGAPPTFLGYGLGTMSNGAEQLSSYAAAWRMRLWGETDMANNLFEGGWLLIFSWMLFRAWVVVFAIRAALMIKDPLLFGAASFALGHAMLQGVIAQMGIHPPVAIWFWLSVGLVISLRNLERREINPLLSLTMSRLPPPEAIKTQLAPPRASRPTILGPPIPKAYELMNQKEKKVLRRKPRDPFGEDGR